jgi:hypothetical protein
MLNLKKILGLAAAMTLVAGTAMAATFNADWTVDAHDAGPGLVIGTNPDSGNLSVDLEVGQSDTVDLFVIFTDETFVTLGEDTIPQPITVSFTFTSPDAMGNVTGTTTGSWLSQAGIVTFNSPIVLNFGSGGTGAIEIALNSTVFNDGSLFTGGLNEGVANGSQISATITYVTAAVPLPAGGVLLLTALGAAMVLRRRKALAA